MFTDRAKAVLMGTLRWLGGFFDATNPGQSMKRLLMALSGFTLCRGTIIMCKAIAHQIYMGRPVDMGMVAALTALTVPVAALAGVIYLLKQDPTTPMPQPSKDEGAPNA
jgi:hypothetical protein